MKKEEIEIKNINIDKSKEEKPKISTTSKEEIVESIISDNENKHVKEATLKSLRRREFQNVSDLFISQHKSIILAALLGVLSSFITTYFINASGLFALGLAGLLQGISYTGVAIAEVNQSGIDVQTLQSIIYWSLYGFLNIPILYFVYRNFTIRFFMLTLFYLAFNISFGFIWQHIPGLQDTEFILNAFAKDGTTINEASKNIGKVILGTIGGITYGITAGFIFKNGGCTGGSDPFSRYLSRTKGMHIGKFNFLFTSITVIFFLILNDFIINPAEARTSNTFFLIILGPKALATIIFIAVTSLVMNIVFPTKKPYMVTINTSLGATMSEKFNEDKWNRGHNITKIQGGQTHSDRYIITMIINSLELPVLVDYVRRIDEKVFITAQPLAGIFGNFDNREKTKEKEVEFRKEYYKKIKEEKRKIHQMPKKEYEKLFGVKKRIIAKKKHPIKKVNKK